MPSWAWFLVGVGSTVFVAGCFLVWYFMDFVQDFWK
jgi:hypothetical protein